MRVCILIVSIMIEWHVVPREQKLVSADEEEEHAKYALNQVQRGSMTTLPRMRSVSVASVSQEDLPDHGDDAVHEAALDVCLVRQILLEREERKNEKDMEQE